MAIDLAASARFRLTWYSLNLTIANCVYVLEPQWNPMVESQAIARVLRIGQIRDVRVIRYIVKHTVEEVRQSLQSLFMCLHYTPENAITTTKEAGICKIRLERKPGVVSQYT